MLFKIVMLLDSEEIETNENVDITDDMLDIDIINQLKEQKVLDKNQSFYISKKNNSELIVYLLKDAVLLLRRNKKFNIN